MWRSSFGYSFPDNSPVLCAMCRSIADTLTTRYSFGHNSPALSVTTYQRKCLLYINPYT